MKPGAVGNVVPQGSTVFVCSNPRCDAVWNKDPQGHCPKCKAPNGSGWSTMHRAVSALPTAVLIAQGAGTACRMTDE